MTKKMFGENDDFARFMDKWTSVMYANSEALLEVRMNDMRCEFGNVKGLIEYLDNTWLKNYKEKFVSAWTNRIIHFGETTTQRVESAHSILKLHLWNSQANFETLLNVVDGLLRIQHNNIKASFELSLNVVQHEYIDELYRRLRGYVSQRALRLIRDELTRGEDVGHDSTRYGCEIRTTHGLPCAHELNHHIFARSPIPLDDIHVYWRKLSTIPENPVDPSGYNVHDEIERVLEKFHACTDEDDRLRIIQQLREISRPLFTPGVVPPAKIKTKGRTPGSSKRKHDGDDSSTRRLPSGFEYVLSTQEASSSRQKKSKVPKMRSASRRTQSATNMAYGHCVEPDWLPHVEGINDVVADGNCGYRCVASGLGLADVDGWRIVRRRMYDEIIGHENLWREVLGSSYESVKIAVHCPENQVGASFKEWLTLPDMGLLVSTAFNVILVNLSHESASTFLPLRSAPPSSLHNRHPVAMINDRNIHWLRVKLRVNAPLPSLYPLCDRYVEDCAKGWRDGFVFRDIAPIAPVDDATISVVDLGTP
ncbi:hypothetical protein Scep_001947 [Stephania cephalantha]|uniref:Protein FAR1-RELATED SEQUENCE n=1 Tax=Stephania cephalantha TaxID=152367 RepID=A0AAP0L9E5_9MAGN